MKKTGNDKSYLRQNKAQMKMFESIIVLVIFFFLLVFGLVIYTKLDAYSQQKKKMENQDLKAMEISQRIAFLSELQHTKEGNVEYDSIDLVKLEVFSALDPDDKKIFSKIFPNTNIRVRQVFPTVKEYDVYEGLADTANMSLIASQVPVSLYNLSDDSYYYGYINISVFNEK